MGAGSQAAGRYSRALIVVCALALIATRYRPADVDGGAPNADGRAAARAWQAVATAPPPRLVVCAGLIRSGSTWQFNAVRVILETATGKPVTTAHGHDGAALLKSCEGAEHCVVKLHEFDRAVLERADMVLVSHRDLRDCLLSTALMFGACYDAQPFAMNHVNNHTLVSMFGHFEQWAAHAAYSMAYANLAADPLAELRRLARALRADVDVVAVRRRLDDELASSTRRVREAVADAQRRVEAAGGNASATKGIAALRWDSKTALSESHTHPFTRAPGAFRRAGVLAYLKSGNGRLRVNCTCAPGQAVCVFKRDGMGKWFRSQRPCVSGVAPPRRLPICDFEADLARVDARHGGWLRAQGYDTSAHAHLTHVVTLWDAEEVARAYGLGTSRVALTSALLSWRRAAAHALNERIIVKLVLVTTAAHGGGRGGGGAAGGQPPVSHRLLGEGDVLLTVPDSFLGEGLLPDARAVWRAAAPHVSGNWAVLSTADCVLSAEFYRAAFAYVQHRTLPHDRLGLSITRTLATPDLALGRGRADTYVLRHTLKGPVDEHDLFVMPAEYMRRLADAGAASAAAGSGSMAAALAPHGCAVLSALRALGPVEIVRDTHWALRYDERPSFEQGALVRTAYEARNWRHALGWLEQFGLAHGQCCAAVARAREDTRLSGFGEDGGMLEVEAAMGSSAVDAATPECCLGAAAEGLFASSMMVSDEADALRDSCASRPRRDGGAGAAAGRAEEAAAAAAAPSFLVVYERLPSGTEGSDVRLLSIMHYLLDQLRASVHFVYRSTSIKQLHAAGGDVLRRHAHRVTWHPMDDALSGLNASWIVAHGIEAVFASLWFYRVGLTPLPLLAIDAVVGARALGGRRLPLSILTDDVHWLRRQSVGDTAERVARVRAFEAWLASHPHIDNLYTVSEQDEFQYMQLRGGHADDATMPTVETVPYASYAPPAPARLDPVKRKHALAKRELITFVGTPHRSNQKDVRWFLTKVLPVIAQRLGALPRPMRANVALVGGYKFLNMAAGGGGKLVTRNWTSEVHELLSEAQSRADAQALKAVECFGQVEPDALAKLLERSRVLINPVQFVGSGISTKVVAGMEARVPVVTTTVAGLRCMPDACSAVKLVPRADAQAFAEAVVDLIIDDDLFESVVTHAERLMRLQLSLRSYRDLGVFERLVALARSPPPADDGGSAGAASEVAVHTVPGFDPRRPWAEADHVAASVLPGAGVTL